jgi:hypothetical protein
MIGPITVECDIHVARRGHGRKEIRQGLAPINTVASSRVPRVARLMALAIHFDGLIRAGAVRDYAEIARLGHVSRARVTQIMNLLLLAPDIQEEILFLPSIERGREPLHLRQLQPIAAAMSWKRQRKIWTRLCGSSRAAG